MTAVLKQASDLKFSLLFDQWGWGVRELSSLSLIITVSLPAPPSSPNVACTALAISYRGIQSILKRVKFEIQTDLITIECSCLGCIKIPTTFSDNDSNSMS